MEWNGNKHFGLVFMKMSVLKPKTGFINSATGKTVVIAANLTLFELALLSNDFQF
jgi:hypothetical protein